MKKYCVYTENDASPDYLYLEEAEKRFERWKDELMTEGVQAYQSYVELVESEDNFENCKTIKKVLAVIDNDRTELGAPKEEGMEFDYWAKWQEIVEEAEA